MAGTVPLDRLEAVGRGSFDLISLDVFDTLLLRDGSVQRGRFGEVAGLLAVQLQAHGHDFGLRTLLAVRREVHERSYQALALSHPEGDVTLDGMIRLQLRLLGLDDGFHGLFVAAELQVERRHLSPNRALLRALARLRTPGKRVIATSDMYLSNAAVTTLIVAVIGHMPVDQVYVSSDLGTTKHSGTLFARVAALEGVDPGRILHCGDNPHADVAMSRAAGCQAVLLPRPRSMSLRRGISALRAFSDQGWVRP